MGRAERAGRNAENAASGSNVDVAAVAVKGVSYDVTVFIGVSNKEKGNDGDVAAVTARFGGARLGRNEAVIKEGQQFP